MFQCVIIFSPRVVIDQWEDDWQGKIEVHGEKPTAVPIYFDFFMVCCPQGLKYDLSAQKQACLPSELEGRLQQRRISWRL
jgi:hypothetical protein